MATVARAARSATTASWADRLLAIVADDATATERLRWLRRVVLAWGAARSLVWTTLDAPLNATLLGASTVALVLAAALAFAPRYESWASRVALPALAAQLVATFPLSPNHFFLELYAVLLLACTGPDHRDDGLVLAGTRWLTAIVLFLTGCQKIAFGHYWHGDFLAFMVGRGDRFADLFQWVLPASEIARLQSYDPFRGDAGPYRVTTPLFVGLSNAVWLAEMLLPIGLLTRRTRTAAAIAALVFVVTLQLGAREMGFALLFTTLLVTFVPLPAARAWSMGALAVLAGIAAAALGVIPGAGALRAWHVW